MLEAVWADMFAVCVDFSGEVPCPPAFAVPDLLDAEGVVDDVPPFRLHL